MIKKRYSFPRRESDENMRYDRLKEDEFFADKQTGYTPGNKSGKKDKRPIKKGHLYFDPLDSEDYREDPYTVAQHFEDRTERPHG